MDYLKTLLVSLVTGIAAYLNPISGEIRGLIAVFAINFVCGLIAAILINKEKFSFKKAFRCIIEAMVFFLLVSSIYYIGDSKGEPQGALQCVSFITYSILYFYGVNILRNLMLIFSPRTIAGRVFSFLYDVFSVEFIKRVPYLSNYINTNKEATK